MANSFAYGGTETRYANDFGGNHIEKIKNTGPSLGVFTHFGHRFCETCQKSKPSDRTKAFKGWKCLDCKSKK
jgi:hypothetical protein